MKGRRKGVGAAEEVPEEWYGAQPDFGEDFVDTERFLKKVSRLFPSTDISRVAIEPHRNIALAYGLSSFLNLEELTFVIDEEDPRSSCGPGEFFVPPTVKSRIVDYRSLDEKVFDLVVGAVPSHRPMDTILSKLARMELAVSESGKLLALGQKKSPIQALKKLIPDAEYVLFQNYMMLAPKGIVPSAPKPFEYTCSYNGVDMTFETMKGLFSHEHLDEGTAKLFGQIDRFAKPGFRMLDLGCGYGALSIYAAKKYQSRVDAVDIDPRAVRATMRNAAVNGVSELVEGFVENAGDGRPSLTYDVVISNVPGHDGNTIVKHFVQNAFSSLKKKGVFVIGIPHIVEIESHIENRFGGGGYTLVSDDNVHKILIARK